MNAPAACILLLLCCFELSLGARHAGNEDAEGTALSAEGILSSRRSAAHHKITEAVSARDCNPDQLPRHLRENAPTEPSDFIVSVAFGYKPLQIRAFLTTFRRHNRDARIVVLVGPDQWLQLREPFCEYGHHFNVEYVTMEFSEDNHYYPLVVLRFRAYLEVLSGLDTSTARNILLTDIRDTLFQGNPFDLAALPPANQTTASGELPYVLFTEEGDLEKNRTFHEDENDLAWIRDCFNDTVVEAMMDQTVVCAGTVLGGRTALIAYMQLMSYVAHFVARDSCTMEWGIDQGIHNFIVHYLKSRRPDMLHFEAVLLSNDDSPIYTLGVITPPKIEVSEDGFAVYNRKGNRAPIVHQIDRHWQLNNHLDFLSQERLKRRLMEKA